MKKIMNGLLCGFIGSIINLSFLLFAPNIKIEVYISTALLWIVIGIFISITKLDISAVFKGVIISILISLPILVFTLRSSFSGAIWSILNTILTGGVIGWLNYKLTEIKK